MIKHIDQKEGLIMNIITKEMAIQMVRKNTETILAELRKKWTILLDPVIIESENFYLSKIVYGYENEDIGFLMSMPVEMLAKKFPSVCIAYDAGEKCLSMIQKAGNFEQTYSITMETQDDVDSMMNGQFLELVSKYTSP